MPSYDPPKPTERGLMPGDSIQNWDQPAPFTITKPDDPKIDKDFWISPPSTVDQQMIVPPPEAAKGQPIDQEILKAPTQVPDQIKIPLQVPDQNPLKLENSDLIPTAIEGYSNKPIDVEKEAAVQLT